MFWEKPGKENTGKTVSLAVKEANKQGIRDIVVSSNEGDTVFELLKQEGIKDFNIVCVTHQVGFRESGFDEMKGKTRQELMEHGVKIYTGTHLFSGIERNFSKKWGGTYPQEIVANTLRLFGQGMKVCVEIAVMVLDAGLIPHDKEIVAIGGTGRGADTAVVIRPTHSRDFFETTIGEIICRPLL
ncbi:MAG TPA: pyruvate kinase alpha/beta domain-containing protein [Halanaerobiales bacterium]|nr:pyruvate kinase alpha/beta domain-containing protein [Halanaerobiales bacterium]